MSQHFKSKYDQMRENSQSTDPASPIPETSDNGPVRNICFVLEDGSMTFLNYGYLISGSIDAVAEKITLFFTSTNVEICGVRLQFLFNDLLIQKAKIIKISNSRYILLESNISSVISNITFQSN